MSNTAKGILACLILAVILMFCFVGCDVAGPGEVAIKVNMAGENRGVDSIPVQTGYVMYSRVSQRVYIYPTYMQNYVWTKAHDEGSPTDESISFNSVEGVNINTDIAMAFKLNAEKVPLLYTTYRKDIKTIISTYLRSAIRKAFVDVAGTLTVDEIYGAKKAWLAQEVTRKLNEELGKYGFEFDYVAFVGNPRLPDNVQQAINAKIQATQEAIKAENELREATAQANKKVAEAEGEARSILTKAEAQAEANRKLIASMGGPQYYIQLEQTKLLSNVQIIALPSNSMPVVDFSKFLK